MEELWLVCEGTPESIDANVLQAILNGVLGAGIIVEPARGSKSLAAVADFLQNQRGGRAAYLMDRDYRRREEAEASFTDGTNAFIWRRHSIENYLLAPAVLVRAFQRLQEQFRRQFARRVPAWVEALPTDSGQIETALRECAGRRTACEAVRLVFHRLWEDLSDTAGRVQQRIPTFTPDLPPEDSTGWRAAILQETQRLRTVAAAAATSPHLEDNAVLGRFDTHLETLSAEEYRANLQFLIDFHGRELLQEFRDWLQPLGVRLSYDRITGELVEVVAEVYASNRSVFGPDDFLHLANGVRALAGLPALVQG